MEKNNKGGKERREIKWCFRAIDFETATKYPKETQGTAKNSKNRKLV